MLGNRICGKLGEKWGKAFDNGHRQSTPFQPPRPKMRCVRKVENLCWTWRSLDFTIDLFVYFCFIYYLFIYFSPIYFLFICYLFIHIYSRSLFLNLCEQRRWRETFWWICRIWGGKFFKFCSLHCDLLCKRFNGRLMLSGNVCIKSIPCVRISNSDQMKWRRNISPIALHH